MRAASVVATTALVLLGAATASGQLVRTGDVTVRGLTADDFPRVKRMSEVFFNRVFPSVGGGFTAHPTEWIETLKKAEAMRAAQYVPNHGFIDAPEVLNEEFLNFRRALERVVAEAKRLHAAGTPLEVAYRNVNLGEYQYWYRAANNMPDVVRKVYAEADTAK